MEKRMNIMLGSKVKALRKQAGLTISQLAELAAMDSGFLNYIENGKKAPSLDTLGKISKALNLPMSEIFSTQIFKPENTFDHQVANQVRAILHGKSREEKEKFLAVLKGLKNSEILSAIHKILRTANRTGRLKPIS
ncbi:MAG: helix-turn-helix domain-containing protein [Elusimicrobiales bacterium]